MNPLINLSDEAVLDLPILAYRPIRAIYFLLEGEKVVYVGQTVNLFGRLGSHEVFEEGMTVRYMEVPDNVDLLGLEALYIHKFHPKYNRVWNKPVALIKLLLQHPELQTFVTESKNPTLVSDPRLKIANIGVKNWRIRYKTDTKWRSRTFYGTRNQAECEGWRLLNAL